MHKRLRDTHNPFRAPQYPRTPTLPYARPTPPHHTPRTPPRHISFTRFTMLDRIKPEELEKVHQIYDDLDRWVLSNYGQ